MNIKVVKDKNYEMMKHCDFLAVTSGTATIETAYLGTPFIIVYKTSKISYQIGKRFIKTAYQRNCGTDCPMGV